MNVLLVGNFLSASTGTRGVCEDLADRLAASGARVIRTSTRSARIPRLVDMVGTCWRRRREYEVAQVDVFSGAAFLWAEATCWTLRRAKKPYVLTLHGGRLPEFAASYAGRVRRLLQQATLVTTPSGYLQEAMGVLRSDIRLLPNPVDLAEYRFRSRVEGLSRLLWLRAFHALYNPSLAIRVLHRLAEDHPGLELTMVGPDKQDGSLARAKRLVEELGVADRVRFLGPVPKREVCTVLEAHDLFLNTSFADNAPVSVVEAQAAGLPVVSTNVGGIPHLLEDGSDALLVPADDPAAMAEAVRSLLNDPQRAVELALEGRSKAAGHDWTRVLPEWLATLSKAARG